MRGRGSSGGPGPGSSAYSSEAEGEREDWQASPAHHTGAEQGESNSIW